jgi:hypothetical protein
MVFPGLPPKALLQAKRFRWNQRFFFKLFV